MDDLDPVAARLAGVMLAIMKGNQNEVMQVTAEFDLSLSQLRALFVLDHASGPLAVNQLADALGLSMPATGRAVDALHRTGLVSRNEDAVDRRVKRIALSETGQGVLTRIAEARAAAVQNLFSRLTPAELAAVTAATDTLDEIVAKHLPSHPRYCVPVVAPSSDTADSGSADLPPTQEQHA